MRQTRRRTQAGLTPGKDDNDVWHNSCRNRLKIFMGVQYYTHYIVIVLYRRRVKYKEYGIDNAKLQRLRDNAVVKTLILDKLCRILDCPIRDIVEYRPDPPQNDP